MDFQKANHCVFALHYHLVLVTKYRKKCIDADIMARLSEITDARCKGWGGSLLEFNGEPDHVHLLVSLPPSAAPSGFVNNLKTTTSRLIRKEFAPRLASVYWKPVFWSRSYCAVSTGGASIDVVRRYIEGQDGCD